MYHVLLCCPRYLQAGISPALASQMQVPPWTGKLTEMAGVRGTLGCSTTSIPKTCPISISVSSDSGLFLQRYPSPSVASLPWEVELEMERVPSQLQLSFPHLWSAHPSWANPTQQRQPCLGPTPAGQGRRHSLLSRSLVPRCRLKWTYSGPLSSGLGPAGLAQVLCSEFLTFSFSDSQPLQPYCSPCCPLLACPSLPPSLPQSLITLVIFPPRLLS